MNKLDGVILINKEKGCTSQDVVFNVKKMLNTKVGHTGTLDPNATGVLPLLLGQGTKISKYLINHDKEYIATLKLGIKTKTADVEGEVIEEKPIEQNIYDKDNEQIKNVLASFVGKQEQIPPIYSAIKVKGKKLYEYARNNEDINIEKRNIEIYNIELLDVKKDLNEIIYKVNCSKGTYIRTLCEDISEKLNTVGYMKDLQRTRVGNFTIKEAISIENFKYNITNKNYKDILPIELIFSNNKHIDIKDINDQKKYLNGVCIEVEDLEDDIYKVYFNEVFNGIGIIHNKKLKRDLVI